MNKMSKRERKAYKLGKQIGYTEGYAKGLYDGNPFNKLTEALVNLKELLNDPKFIEQLRVEAERRKLAKEEEEDARREAYEEAMRLDDNENTLKYKGGFY